MRQHGLAACREQSLARAAGVNEGFVAQRIRDLLRDALNENADVEARFNAICRRRYLPEFVARAQVQRGFESMECRTVDRLCCFGRMAQQAIAKRDSRGEQVRTGLEFLARGGAPINNGRGQCAVERDGFAQLTCRDAQQKRKRPVSFR